MPLHKQMYMVPPSTRLNDTFIMTQLIHSPFACLIQDQPAIQSAFRSQSTSAVIDTSYQYHDASVKIEKRP